jgi:PTH1 family peptidyl-tRNA hydrolase
MAKLLVGLGNPGKKYAKTRHNIGFFVLDRLAEAWRISLHREKFSGHFGEHREAGEKVYLLQPQTFMNLSGDCVQPWVHFLKLEPQDLLVVHDELDLPLGRMKAQWAAGPAGHQGVSSIALRLGHQEFNRLRVGVGHPGRQKEVNDFVLSPFHAQEQPVLEETLDLAVEALTLFIEKGLDAVARMVNRRAP